MFNPSGIACKTEYLFGIAGKALQPSQFFVPGRGRMLLEMFSFRFPDSDRGRMLLENEIRNGMNPKGSNVIPPFLIKIILTAIISVQFWGMDKHSITCDWNEGLHFTSTVKGHVIELDSPPAQGPNPKPLMLVALAGCTGMDVVSLLQKTRVDFEDLKIEVMGDLTDEHPRVYSKAHIIYKVIGGNPDKEKVIKAIELSQEKYCGVSAMMRKAMEITWEVQYS